MVGFVRIEMNGMPLRASSAMTTDVLAICISDSAPSCMRAPPEADTISNGIPFSAERCASRATFSPTTEPIDPPMKAKSMTARLTGWPWSRAYPVRTASSSPAFLYATCTRSL